MKQESQLVEKILRRLGSKSSSSFSPWRLSLGPGDDAAVLSPSSRSELVLSCDASLEGVHFRRATHPPSSIGYKSLARAASDLAAMGAAPRYYLLTVGVPNTLKAAWLDEFLGGMRRAARELGMTIIGGDTTTSSQVIVSITVLGEIGHGLALRRSGARPGDLIYVSGTLGEAQLGLEFALAGGGRDPRLRAELQPHLYPTIRIALGSWLARRRIPSAMMDISDGLSTDLTRLCQASGVGARVYADRIRRVRIPTSLPPKLRRRKLDPLQMALHGGEDYELLFTVPKKKSGGLKKCPEFSSLTLVGEITAAKTILLISNAGRVEKLKPRGWDPF
ncbi:MAG TPA: thiamine-phosphate kinase [Candidatus Acidoferrales bacterium]